MTYSHLSRTLAAAAIAGAIVTPAISHAEEVTIGQTFLEHDPTCMDRLFVDR